jgi:DNA-binding GntR family transcriptional regulator
MDHIKATTALQASRPTIGDAVTSVVEAIRDQILTGMLPAGGQLKQNRLAQSLGVSHIPVREALKALESEGFVIWHPRRGAFVADLTIDSASEIWELRAQLEPVAVRHSVPRITAASIQQARVLMESAAATTRHIDWMRLNWDFHRALYSTAARPLLLDMINALWHNVDRYCTVLTRANDNQHLSCDHAQLLEAYERRDVDAAIATVTTHMAKVGGRVRALLQSRETGKATHPTDNLEFNH